MSVTLQWHGNSSWQKYFPWLIRRTSVFQRFKLKKYFNSKDINGEILSRLPSLATFNLIFKGEKNFVRKSTSFSPRLNTRFTFWVSWTSTALCSGAKVGPRTNTCSSLKLMKASLWWRSLSAAGRELGNFRSRSSKRKFLWKLQNNFFNCCFLINFSRNTSWWILACANTNKC